jgi:hypothetical protein
MADLPTVFFGRDSFLVHSGKYAVSVASMSDAFPMGHHWRQTLLVGPEAWGKVATFKAWVRNNGVEGRAYLLVQAYNDTASRMAEIWNVDHDEALKRLGINKIDDPLLDLGWDRTQFNEPLTDWVEREAVTYVPPGTNVMFVRCGLLGTGQVLFDDASLTFKPAPPFTKLEPGRNLFTDPDSRTARWRGTWRSRPMRVRRSSWTAPSLTAAAQHPARAFLGRPGRDAHRRGQSVPGRSLRGQRVRLTAWFKGDSLIGTSLVKIYRTA